jgi:acetyl-CoA carboxylase carboxyl transferase subunit alpha
MNGTWLDFEKPIIELERKIEELKSRAGGDSGDRGELDRLEKKADRLRKTSSKSRAGSG